MARAADRAATRRDSGPLLLKRRRSRMHPHMLRHTVVTTMLDVDVDPRDTQIAARHADRRDTVRYDRARTDLDRRPSYIVAAYMSSGT